MEQVKMTFLYTDRSFRLTSIRTHHRPTPRIVEIGHSILFSVSISSDSVGE